MSATAKINKVSLLASGRTVRTILGAEHEFHEVVSLQESAVFATLGEDWRAPRGARSFAALFDSLSARDGGDGGTPRHSAPWRDDDDCAMLRDDGGSGYVVSVTHEPRCVALTRITRRKRGQNPPIEAVKVALNALNQIRNTRISGEHKDTYAVCAYLERVLQDEKERENR